MVLFMIAMVVLILLVLTRAIMGPTVIDRLISINAISGKVSVIILLLAFIVEDYGFIDVALVFMLCGFTSGLWILKALTHGDKGVDIPSFEIEGEGVRHHD